MFILQIFSATVHCFHHPNESNVAEMVWGIMQCRRGVLGPVYSFALDSLQNEKQNMSPKISCLFACLVCP